MEFVISIDTEEDMPQWRPENVFSVKNLSALPALHEILLNSGATPTYLVDSAVIANEQSINFLSDVAHKGQTEVGLHLHCWNTEPILEEENAGKATVLNELSSEIQRNKINNLHKSFVNRFGFAPSSFRAGRYGLSSQSALELKKLGFIVDSSVVPEHSFAHYGAPDYRGFDRRPFMLGFDNGSSLLELPVSAGLVTRLPSWLKKLYFDIPGWTKIPGALHRLNLARMLWLRPTSYTVKEMYQLARFMQERSPNTIFNIMFHSSEVYPGASPYNQTEEDVENFLNRLKAIIQYLLSLGARPATLTQAALYIQEKQKLETVSAKLLD